MTKIKLRTKNCFGVVRMEEEDIMFHKNQVLTPPVVYCTITIDQHSLAKNSRMKKLAQLALEQKYA